MRCQFWAISQRRGDRRHGFRRYARMSPAPPDARFRLAAVGRVWCADRPRQPHRPPGMTVEQPGDVNQADDPFRRAFTDEQLRNARAINALRFVALTLFLALLAVFRSTTPGWVN